MKPMIRPELPHTSIKLVTAPYRVGVPRKINTPRTQLRGLGCPCPPPRLGLLIGAAAQNASQATKTSSDVMTGASAGAAVGSVVPVVGTVIGAAVGAVVGAIGSLFGPAKEGMAAETWDDMVAKGYLGSTKGTAFDERYFGEALKGAMDKGKNVWGTVCGADGHQNPDCFYNPLALAIIAGYKNKIVPLTATEPQVWSSVVLPWLKSGANGHINWSVLANEPTQQLLILAAVDRYLNGLPITRANMPAYITQASNYAQWSTPSITQALASLLPAQAPPTQTAAAPLTIIKPGSTTTTVATTPTATTPAPAVTGTTATGSPVVAPSDTNALIQQLIAQGASQDQALQAAMASLEANGINSQTPQVQQQLQAAVQPTGMSSNTLLFVGGGLLAVILLTRKESSK